MSHKINLKIFTKPKITTLIFGFAVAIVSIFFLIFNENILDFPQVLVLFGDVSNSRLAKINTIVSIAGVTALFSVLYFAYPTKLNDSVTLLKNNKYHNIIFYFFIVLISISIFIFGNLNNRNFWFDESGQIWMSLGLNHFTSPFSEPGNLKDVYLNNNNYNLDPGGFSYLLHFWMSLGDSPVFLRILPLLFSLGVLALSWCLLKTNFTRSRLAILFPLVYLGSPLFVHYSFELRAYSFEMLVALSALTLAIQSKKILESSASSFAVGLWFAFGLSSRYSSIFPVALAIAFVAFDTIRSNQKKTYLNLSLIVAPIFLSAVLIFIYVLSKQNPSGEPPSYVSDLFLFHRGFFGIFFAPWAILVWFPVVSLLIVSVRVKNNHFLQRYVAYSLLLLITLLIASAFNKYPLAFYSRFDISIHAVYWFGWVIILSLLMSKASRLLSNEKHFLLVGYLAAILVILASFARYQPNDSIHEIFDSCYDHDAQASILANEGSIPTVKYLFELGPLKKLDHVYAGIDFFSDGLDIGSTTIPSKNINFDRYDYFLFSFFDRDSEIYSIISRSSLFVRCDVIGPSEMYVRAVTN